MTTNFFVTAMLVGCCQTC